MTAPCRSTAIRTRVFALAAVVVAGSLLAGCVAIEDDDVDISAPQPPQSTPAPIVAQPTVADIVIVDLREASGPDPSLVRITGTIVNRSSHDAVRVQVKVEGRDPSGRALTRVNTQALADVIPPNGSSAFDATMPRSAAIRDYHAEITSR
jgi:hypothetical protein